MKKRDVMKRLLKVSSIIIIMLISFVLGASLADLEINAASTNSDSDARVIQSMNEGWKFHKGDVIGGQSSVLNDTAWKDITLPHTWNNLDGQDGGTYWRGDSWYRKKLVIDAAYQGKRLYIQFNAANQIADVYINGKHLGQHIGGYSIFRFDITPYIQFGTENILAVKVNNAHDESVSPLGGDFTFCGGLHRQASLIITEPVHVDLLDYGSSGVYVTQSNVSSTSADIEIKTKIHNNLDNSQSIQVKTKILDADNQIVGTLNKTISIDANTTVDVTQLTTIDNPHLWNGREDAYMYTVEVQLVNKSKVLDKVEQPLGIRYFSVDPNKGFILNGQQYKIKGIGRHHDWLDKGYALSKANHDTDMELIKEMGTNAIRLVHYQHSEYFYNLCDEEGMVVWAEIPNVQRINNTNAYHLNTLNQLKELIRQNYNHPSIFFWGIGNETTYNKGKEDPTQLYHSLESLAKQEDPNRLTVAASNNSDGHKMNHITDIIAWNKYMGWYNKHIYNGLGSWADAFHQKYPNRSVGISEYGAGSSINHHEDNPSRPTPKGKWHPEEWQNIFHEENWRQINQRDFLWGSFIWNMFDFAADNRSEGELDGINDKGLVTRDRQVKKDSFYFYKANWTESPLVYITSRRFTERTVANTPVKVYSNCDQVELFVNEISQGVKTGDEINVFEWKNIGLVKGENKIRAVAIKNGVTYEDTCQWTLETVENMIITASSHKDLKQAYKGMDGDQTTRWAAINNQYPQTWQVDLLKEESLTGIEMLWFKQEKRSYQYKVETSLDGINWTMAVDRTNNSVLSSQPLSDDFTAKARYIKVTTIGCSKRYKKASFYELKLNYEKEPIGIQCGIDKEYISVDKKIFSPDDYFNGGVARLKTADIDNTDDDLLYKSYRFGEDLTYSIPVSNAFYNITLKFIEPWHIEENKRVFNVNIENVKVVDSLDLYKEVGKFTAFDQVIEVEVTDGQLDIHLDAIKGDPIISAILIESVDNTK